MLPRLAMMHAKRKPAALACRRKEIVLPALPAALTDELGGEACPLGRHCNIIEMALDRQGADKYLAKLVGEDMDFLGEESRILIGDSVGQEQEGSSAHAARDEGGEREYQRGHESAKPMDDNDAMRNSWSGSGKSSYVERILRVASSADLSHDAGEGGLPSSEVVKDALYGEGQSETISDQEKDDEDRGTRPGVPGLTDRLPLEPGETSEEDEAEAEAIRSEEKQRETELEREVEEFLALEEEVQREHATQEGKQSAEKLMRLAGMKETSATPGPRMPQLDAAWLEEGLEGEQEEQGAPEEGAGPMVEKLFYGQRKKGESGEKAEKKDEKDEEEEGRERGAEELEREVERVRREREKLERARKEAEREKEKAEEERRRSSEEMEAERRRLESREKKLKRREKEVEDKGKALLGAPSRHAKEEADHWRERAEQLEKSLNEAERRHKAAMSRMRSHASSLSEQLKEAQDEKRRAEEARLQAWDKLPSSKRQKDASVQAHLPASVDFPPRPSLPLRPSDRCLPAVASHASLGHGKEERVYHDGRRIVSFPNGAIKEADASGVSITFFPNSDVKRLLPDGREEYYYHTAGAWHTSFPSGMQAYHFASGQSELHRPDGSKDVLFPDSLLRRILPDGSSFDMSPSST